MSKALENKVKLNDVVSVKDFGAVGDGVTDDTSAFSAALTQVKAQGGTLFIPAGTYIIGPILLGGGSKVWSMVGAGKSATILRHRDGSGTLLSGAASSVGYTLRGFTVDCQHSVYSSASANHGIVSLNTSNVSIEDVHVEDYKNAAILVYSTTPNVYSNCVMTDVSADGLGNAANGLLYAEMDKCGFVRCSVKNLSKDPVISSPGYGIQLKNDCRFGYITDCDIENCVAGIGMGSDTATQGARQATITNVRIRDCSAGIITSHNQNNVYSNIVIDMASSSGTYLGENGIDLQASATKNTFTNIIVRNVRSVRSAVIMRSGATDNYVHVSNLDNINTSGKLVTFESGAQYNFVQLSRMTNPRVRSVDLYTMATLTTASDANAWVYDGYPMNELQTIASGAISLANSMATTLYLDTEGATATDDLDTITNTFARDGQEITLFTVNDARDIVVRHNVGNIILSGGTNITLGTRRSFITLRWRSTSSAWFEVNSKTYA